MRLKESFYKKDTLNIVYPMYLNCYIDGKKDFWSDYFRDYIDTARLAHEILYNPYYLNESKESGVLIK